MTHREQPEYLGGWQVMSGVLISKLHPAVLARAVYSKAAAARALPTCCLGSTGCAASVRVAPAATWIVTPAPSTSGFVSSVSLRMRTVSSARCVPPPRLLGAS